MFVYNLFYHDNLHVVNLIHIILKWLKHQLDGSTRKDRLGFLS